MTAPTATAIADAVWRVALRLPCPKGCGFVAVALTEGRRLRAMAAHLIACHPLPTTAEGEVIQ